uniref:WRKY transcription factor WRKY51-like n=1 Tax=Erigeron canadensis TaxID=72917 RepID=UPI001CB8B290|nr:WRKY transcription factor WRKY51-like [Erigeron canadensis]
MAVDLVGLNTVEHFNRLFQNNHHAENFNVVSSSTFQQAVSALKRSGHARFRRAPAVVSDPHAPSISSTTQSQEKNERSINDKTMSSSLISSSFAEGSVSKCSSLGIVAPAPSFSAKKPPLPSSHRRRNGTDSPSVSVSRPACHCCKRRKSEIRRKVKKIPITGSKVDSIPADDYTWKKYGQKKVEGSPFPRVYYKCNSAKGCPARKRVEVVVADSKMLVVTYDREHRHHHTPTPLPTPVLPPPYKC